jgi:Aerotolerance regulator N-terminal/von Willebrand factor type A domain
MGLLAPWFLIGAAAVGLPLYLHLLRRHTATPNPFSSSMFLEQRTQSSIRHRRLRYLALLAMRLALLLLLAFAFASPYLNRSSASGSGAKLSLLVIDNSFSMRAGSRLDDAKRAALSLLDSRRPAERAQVATLGSELHVLTQPLSDTPALRAAVNSIQPGDSRSSFAELAQAVASVVANARMPVEVHLFSDMQRSSMPSSFPEMVLPQGATLVLHPMATTNQPNWTVESASVPNQVWDPKKARVQAVVAGFDTPAATRTVSLVAGGKVVATKSVQVPANGRASVEFQGLDVPYGFSRCEIHIDSADTFPADDAYVFAVERSDPQRVLFVREASDSQSALFFNSALSAASESAFSLESLAVDRLAGVQLNKYAFVVLSDVLSLPSDFQSSLEAYVRAGGSLLIATGTSAARRGRIPVFGDNILDVRDYERDGQRFLTVGSSDSSHPSMESGDNWAGVKFYYAVDVDPSSAQVVARLTDQTPLLLDKKVGEGRVLLLTSGLDNLTNDFPTHPVFVAFVKQTARYLSGAEERGGARQVNSFFELRTAREQAVSVEIVDPAGKRPLSLQEATTAQSYKLTSAGFYQLRLANGRQDLVGVNADRRESNLEPMSSDVLALWGRNSSVPAASTAGDVPGQQEESTKRHSIWWYAMFLVLAAALAESFFAGRYLSMLGEDS